MNTFPSIRNGLLTSTAIGMDYHPDVVILLLRRFDLSNPLSLALSQPCLWRIVKNRRFRKDP